MKTVSLFMLLFGFLLFISPANAETIYATGENGTNLVTIDSDTGIVTTIGPTNVTQAMGAAFSPYGTLYTVTETGPPVFLGDSPPTFYETSYLGTFDLVTGEVTTVGSEMFVEDMVALEFASSGTLYGGSTSTNSFYTIDIATGTPSLVGALDFNMVMDFAFDSSETLWAIASDPSESELTSGLFTIDLNTGHGTQVSEISGSIMGITFDSNDTLYATGYDFSSGFYTVDTATGAKIEINDTGISYLHGGDSMVSETTVTTVTTVVPEPISSMLFIVGGAMMGVRRLRKRVS